MKIVRRAVIIMLGIAVVVAGRYFMYYDGSSYSAPGLNMPAYDQITTGSQPAAQFTDAAREGTGLLLVDRGHANQFAVDEISVLLERVLSRGFAVQFFDSGDKEKERETALKTRLAGADAFAVVLPKNPFTGNEITTVGEFVDKGGRLILIGDPTRPGELNSLANQFGMSFQTDYLYNQKDNEGNFRNVYMREFKQNGITAGLQQVVLYTASSLSPAGLGLGFTDADTFSNQVQSREHFTPMVLSRDDRVLAISDVTMMGEPYNAAYDNNRLVSNIADWLTTSNREFLLYDFPHFLKGKTKIEVSDPRLTDLGIKVRSALEGFEKPSELGKLGSGDKARVYVGLLSSADNVSAELRAGGISVVTENKTSVKVEGLGEVYMAETAMMYLSRKDGANTLIILADTESGLQRVIDSLPKVDFQQWMLRDDLALSYNKKETPTPTPAVRPTPTPTAKPAAAR